MKNTVYVGVRTDIPLEHQMVQAAHAALEAGFNFEKPEKISHLVLLDVNNASDLDRWIERMEMAGIEHQLFFEPDHNFGHTAFATRPIHCDQERKVFRKGRLWNAKGN